MNIYMKIIYSYYLKYNWRYTAYFKQDPFIDLVTREYMEENKIKII